MSFTFTGLLVKFAGGSFAGKNASLMREPNPPKFVPQFTASRLFSGPFGTGRELKKSFKLSLNPPPYSSGISGEWVVPDSLIGFSVRNCLRLDQKPSVTNFVGVPNFGTAEEGTGIARAPGSGARGLFISGGSRLIIESGNVF